MSELTWQDQAACTGSNPDLWFPGRNDDNAYARSICRACPVRQECLNHALTEPETIGIWGGTTPRERRAMRGPRLVGKATR